MVALTPTYNIKGYEDPDSNITRPLSCYFKAQHDQHWMPTRQQIASYMFDKGYVSASIEYANIGFCNDVCSGKERDTCFIAQLMTNTKGVANHWVRVRSIKTAVNKVCNRSTVDCSKGLVVGGMSYGAYVTNMLVQYEPRITAILSLGFGKPRFPAGIPPAVLALASFACLEDPGISQFLPKSKRRYLVGGADRFFVNGTPFFGLKEYSGYDCNQSFDCIQPDGSGYYITQPEDYTQEDRDMWNGTINFGGHYLHTHNPPHTKNDTQFLPSFLNESNKWSLQSSFDWLADAGRVGVDKKQLYIEDDLLLDVEDDVGGEDIHQIDRAAGKHGVLGMCAILAALFFTV